MTPAIRELIEQSKALEQRLEQQVKADYPVGCRVSYYRGGNNRIGKVEDHVGFGSDTRLRVRNERTDKTTDVTMFYEPVRLD